MKIHARLFVSKILSFFLSSFLLKFELLIILEVKILSCSEAAGKNCHSIKQQAFLPLHMPFVLVFFLWEERVMEE